MKSHNLKINRPKNLPELLTKSVSSILILTNACTLILTAVLSLALPFWVALALSILITTCSAMLLHSRPSKVDSVKNGIIIPSHNRKERFFIDPERILFVAAAGNYVEIFFRENSKVSKRLIRNKISQLESVLQPHTYLVRCHRTYIVNLNMVEAVDGTLQGLKLIIKDSNQTVPVARRHCKHIAKKLQERLSTKTRAVAA